MEEYNMSKFSEKQVEMINLAYDEANTYEIVIDGAGNVVLFDKQKSKGVYTIDRIDLKDTDFVIKMFDYMDIVARVDKSIRVFTK
jgi:hypothetical protein